MSNTEGLLTNYNTLEEYETQFTKVVERVEFILKHNILARDNDTTLTFLYWYKFEGLGDFQSKAKLIYNKYSNLFDLAGKFTSPESISRARRHIQNESGLYKPSLKAKKNRMIRYETIKEFIHKKK